MKTKRKIVTVTVFSKIDYNKPVPFSAINIELQPDDVIRAGWSEPFYSENESWDGHWQLEVLREREENDKEYQERTEREESYKKESKKKRYESYLTLKKEFEKNGNDN